ncbi:MAG: hypothetical protein MJ025_03040 [Victivallaceae bacterium]|nr:hypothetical protein [Victivallaceae bacterium]
MASSDIAATTEPVEAPVEVDNRGKWYVMRALSSRENKVRDDLRAEILKNDKAGVYEVYVPTKMVMEVRQRDRKSREKKLFPGYIFVRMDL